MATKGVAIRGEDGEPVPVHDVEQRWQYEDDDSEWWTRGDGRKVGRNEEEE